MRALLLVAVAGLPGCFGRVALPPPPPRDADLAVRQQALLDFAGFPQKVDSRTQHLLLGNGLTVEDPRDLVPWVEPDSPTAAYAFAFETAQSRASVLGSAGLVAPVLGIGALVATVVIGASGSGAPVSRDALPLMVGATTGALLGTSFLVAAVWLWAASQVERDRAFEAYPRDLVHRLGLDAP